MVISQVQHVAGMSRKKKIILYHLDYINKLLQYYYLTVRQSHCQIVEKPFYATLVQPLEAQVRQYEPCTNSPPKRHSWTKVAPNPENRSPSECVWYP